MKLLWRLIAEFGRLKPADSFLYFVEDQLNSTRYTAESKSPRTVKGNQS